MNIEVFFSLKFKSVGFDILCNFLSPNILTRGLWSTNIVKWLQPSRNNLFFFSGPKLLPKLHLQLVHNYFLLWLNICHYRMLISNHLYNNWVLCLQYCCFTTKPMPFLDQSMITIVSFGVIKCQSLSHNITYLVFSFKK